MKNIKISRSFLARFDLIILAEQTDDLQTWNLFRNYVRGGGNLITFLPVRLMQTCLALKSCLEK